MKVKVYPSPMLKGTVIPPSSKSHTVRAILFASLARGKSTIANSLLSEDAEAMKEAVKALGATVEQEKELLIIEGMGGVIQPSIINAKDSGLVLRFLTALGALF